MHHTFAYFASTAQNVETDTAALADSILTIQNGHFLPQRQLPLLFGAVASTNMQRARLSTPSLLQVTTPFLRPINAGVTFGVPQRVQDWHDDPLVLAALEEVSLLTTHAGAAAENVYGVFGGLWQQTPVPAGNIYTLRGTSVGPAVANVWTQIAMTWQVALPTGLYALIGAEVFSATNIATRFILENQVPRPGCLGIQALTNYGDEMFRVGGLGTWGQFHNYAMPLVETLCTAADASFEVYIDLVRIG